MSTPNPNATPASSANSPEEPWRPLFDLSIESYYAGDMEMGRWASECLLSLADVPEPVRARARSNALFYASTLAALIPSARIHPLLFDTPPGRALCNPSVAADAGGWRAIVRSSNYAIDRGRYYTRDGDPGIRTDNYLLGLDGCMAPHDIRCIEDRTELQRFPFPVAGFEDCRLFRWRGDWYASATSREHAPDGLAQMALLRLRGGVFDDLQILSGVEPGRHEKNWMPLVRGDDLLFVYSCSPTIVLRYEDSRLQEVARHAGPVIARDFRGGSQGVPLDGGYLFAVHEAVDRESDRAYSHRFIFLDDDLRLTQVSPQLSLLSRTIEFCCGMARREDELAISFGADDAEAYVATVKLDELLAILRPVYG